MNKIFLRSTGEEVFLVDAAQPKALRKNIKNRTAVLIKGNEQLVLNQNLRFLTQRTTLGSLNVKHRWHDGQKREALT